MKAQPSLAVGDDFINAKVRGMRSRLHQGAELLALAECRSLPDLYRRIFPDATISTHLEFERGLLADALDQFDRLRLFLQGGETELFRWLMIRYQLDDLKVVLRGLFTRAARAELEAHLSPLPGWMALPVDDLLVAPDLTRFAQAAPDVFRHCLKAQTRRNQDPFYLEMCLDNAYYRQLLRLLESAPVLARRVIEFDADSRSLLTFMRARFGYQRPAEEILPYLTPSGHYLSMQFFDESYVVSDAAGFIQRVPATMLPASERQGILDATAVERAMERRLYAPALRTFAECVLDSGIVFAYYYLKRAEIANLVRICEGVRHGLPVDEIRPHLLLREG